MKINKTHTFDKDTYEKFMKLIEANGMKASTWLNNKIKEFVKEEEEWQYKKK